MVQFSLKRMFVVGCVVLLMGCSATPSSSTSQAATEAQTVATAETSNPNLVNFEKATRLNLELAIAYLNIGNTSRAKEKLNRALKLSPDLPEVYAAHGYYYEKIGEAELAEDNYRKAIQLNSQAGQYHNNYGAFLCRQARYAEAEKEFLIAVRDRAYPKAAETYENLGLCTLETHNKAKAKEYFARALKQDSNRYEAILELAMMSYEEKDFNTAANYLERYRHGTGYSPRALWLGIKIAEAQNDEDQVASLKLLLKNKFPRSKEYELLQQQL